jgi:hypothetical protein
MKYKNSSVKMTQRGLSERGSARNVMRRQYSPASTAEGKRARRTDHAGSAMTMRKPRACSVMKSSPIWGTAIQPKGRSKRSSHRGAVATLQYPNQASQKTTAEKPKQ